MIVGTLKFAPIAIRDFDPDADAVDVGEHKVIEGKAKQQWLGDMTRRPKLSLMLHREFIDPVATYDALFAIMRAREVIAIIEDDGTINGTFLIASVRPSQQRKLKDGFLLSQIVDVSFVEPGLDTSLVPRPDPIAVKGASSPTTTDGPAEDLTSKAPGDFTPSEIARR